MAALLARAEGHEQDVQRDLTRLERTAPSFAPAVQYLLSGTDHDMRVQVTDRFLREALGEPLW